MKIKRNIKWATGPALLALSMGAGANSGMIDLFTDPVGGQVVSDVQDGPAGADQSSVGPFTSIVGGYRDIFVNLVSGGDDLNLNGVCDTGDACTVMSISDGSLRFLNDTGVEGVGTVQWDGDDGSIALNPAGIGTNLKADGAEQIEFTIIEADQTFEFWLEVYTDAANFTKVRIESTPVPAGSPVTRTIQFAALENAALCGNPGLTGDPQVLEVLCGGANNQPVDFSDFGAAQVRLNVAGTRTVALDMEIGPIVGDPVAVPEPATWGLMGAAMLAGGFSVFGFRRRKGKRS